MKTRNAWFFNAMFVIFIVVLMLWAFGFVSTIVMVVTTSLIPLTIVAVIVYALLVGFGAMGGDK